MPTHRKRPRDFSHAGVLVFDMLCIKKKKSQRESGITKKNRSTEPVSIGAVQRT
jgi:hypothetical protein